MNHPALQVVVRATCVLLLCASPALAQFSQQGPKLVGSGAEGRTQQGGAVSLSADGNTAIVGAPEDDGGRGAAWIWTRSGGVWTQQGPKLVGSGAVGNAFQGAHVSISADGNTAIVGGHADSSGAGAAWIWTRNAGVWTQQGSKLVGSGAIGAANQGWAVSLSGDGNTAIVGGWGDNNFAGAAWVWTRSGAIWTQQGPKLVGSGAVGNATQGWSVSLSDDGATAMVGGPGGPDGATWAWTRSAGVWTQQGSKLVGAGGAPTSQQGWSVSLSADGDTAIVGAPGDGTNGAAWIWTRSAGVWTQQGPKLVGSGGSGDSQQQGYSVDLSGDGNTAIVGGYRDNLYAGAAWVWTRNSGVWTQQGSKLVGSGPDGAAQQGWSAALSADGNTAVVGGPYDNREAGASWAWTRSGGIWTQQGSKLVGTGARGHAEQGNSTSLSADGNTAIVGGRADNTNGGAAWVWTRTTGVWSQQGVKLVGSGAVANAVQGISVALSADGNTAIVGGYHDDNSTGAAWVWTRSAGAWSQQGSKLVGTGAIGNAHQGFSVALSADGNTAIIGGFADNSSAGAAWIWTRSAGVWTQQGSKLVGSGAVGNALQGNSVSISADGNTALVGGPSDNSSAGAIWVWTRSGGVWTQQGSKLVGSGTLGNAYQGFSVSLSADGNTALVGGFSDNANTGAAWVWTRSGGLWTQQGTKLVGSGAAGPANQGHSVSLSADGNMALVGGNADNSGTGAAWVWTRSGGFWTQQGSKLVGSAAVGTAQQGNSAALAADASTAILGGYGDDEGTGAVWIFVAPPPTIAINDVTLAEGNAGNTAFNFNVTLSKPSGSPVSVDYATAAGTSTAGTDYTSVSGTVTFNPFVTTQPITVNVSGETAFEPNETFFVNLTNPTNATIFDNQGLGTITNDDGPVADISVTKTGPTNAFRSAPVNYTITLSNAGPQTASNVVVTDVIPAGTNFVSATPSQGTCSGTSTIICNLGAIAAGANASIRLVITSPTMDGSISNTATATNTPESDPTPANNAGTSIATVFGAGDIPTLAEWALIALAMALAAFAAVKIR